MLVLHSPNTFVSAVSPLLFAGLHYFGVDVGSPQFRHATIANFAAVGDLILSAHARRFARRTGAFNGRIKQTKHHHDHGR